MKIGRSQLIRIARCTALLMFISTLVAVACANVTRWPTSALYCGNDDFCHAVQQDASPGRDDALAALDGTNVERWHQQCRCTILRCDYSPSLTAIVYDPVIKIIDRDATRRVVACLANIHAIYLESDRDDRLSSG
jgi:hypothetical protein